MLDLSQYEQVPFAVIHKVDGKLFELGRSTNPPHDGWPERGWALFNECKSEVKCYMNFGMTLAEKG